MNILKVYLIEALLSFGVMLCVSVSTVAQYKQSEDVTRLFQSIEKSTGGKLGISALHLEKKLQINYKGKETFPMASTYKFPIAVCFLHMADIGQIDLNAYVRVTTSDLRPGHSPLAEQVVKEGEKNIPLKELLRLMAGESDNTACDLILRMVGGPVAVNNYLKQYAFLNIRVDRSEAELMLHSHGVHELPDNGYWTFEALNELIAKVPEQDRKKAIAEFMKDPRDTATPIEMVNILELTFTNMLLSTKNTNLLMDIMKQTTTGQKRIKAILPGGTVVAHKTGTGAEFDGVNVATNDIGIIYLPQNKGHILLSVYISGATASLQDREAAIAQVARIIYDHWTQP